MYWLRICLGQRLLDCHVVVVVNKDIKLENTALDKETNVHKSDQVFN